MTTPDSRPQGLQGLWITVSPGVFVVLWATGFIGAKLGLPHAEPFTFLFVRFAILAVLLGLIGLVLRAPWPTSAAEAGRIALTGVLVHGTYLGGVFAAIHWGVPAGVSALIVGIQPLLTAIAAGPFLGEKVTVRQWAGFLIGLGGVALVVADKLTLSGSHLWGVGSTGIAVLGMTAGVIYQKRHGGAMDLRTGSAIQFAAAALPMGVLALAFETMEIHWTGEFIFALTWLIFVLSIGAISLLFFLIRRGAASRVASLFYLVPPVAALMAWPLFGETLGPTALFGMGVTVIGVAMVTRA